ncbi:MAG TPA: hypothetical protein PLU68_06145 [Thermotogota bacterium]|jgi:adenosylhomocysteine nucleosidase|nr:5'-methylthioadenosine/S-adenosylhomocysteine nucleosidase [Thermotogaceae bacterium]OQC30435.1 MAG: Aminodeoxyfutalosine nucleosidase [Thermotogota bacterium ADurb.Bin062]HPN28495.1 hypothetical protein [Thermotogota bacterium]HPY46988.1 hypothetical protein [Thermotogota bacterium]
MILIESAFKDELEPIVQQLVVFEEGKVFDRDYTRGVIGRNEIVACSGMTGKVETSVMTQKLIELFHPACVFFVSCAVGLAPDLNPGDIVLGEAYREHDRPSLDDTLLPLITGNIEFAYRLRQEYPHLKSGVIISGDTIPTDAQNRRALYLTHRASAADMHSAAAAIVCRMNGIGFLSFQTIVGRTDFPSLEAYDCQRRTHAAAAATFLASYIEKNFLSISCAEKK